MQLHKEAGGVGKRAIGVCRSGSAGAHPPDIRVFRTGVRPGAGVGRGHNVYMVEWVGIVAGRHVTDVQGRRSDGGHIMVQKTLGERVRLRRPAGVPPLL